MRTLSLFLFLILPRLILAQTPGVIFKPAGAPGNAKLDPNNDGYVSASANGFSGMADTGPGNSEINYRSLPQLKIEPMSDLGPGPSCKFTDFADTGNKDAAGFYVNSANDYLFRFRLGGSAPNAKGYSILIDADQKFGTVGTQADPNAVPGNPGFEIEVVLTTGGTTPGVFVYTVDGRSHAGGGVPTPVAVVTGATLPFANYAQKAIAATTACGDLDVFYDFYVPYTHLQAAYPGFTTSTQIRMVANTVIAPMPALHLNQISDLAGLETTSFGNNVVAAWTALIQSSPAIKGDTIQVGGNFGSLRSEPPVVNSPLAAGTSTISGTSVESPGTTIRVFINGAQVGTTTVQANSTWTFTNPSNLITGQNIFATAHNTAANETESVTSNTVTISGSNCTGAISQPIAAITCSSTKGIEGTVQPGTPVGTVIRLYEVTTAGISEVAFGSLQPVSDAALGFFAKCNTQTQNCNSGPNCFSGTYLLTATEPGKCESGFNTTSTACIGSGMAASNAPVITTSSVILGSNTVTGTYTVNTAPARVFLFGNGVLIGSHYFTSTGAQTWSINVAFITAGMKVTALGLESGKCLSAASNLLASGATAPSITGPVFAGATTVSGTSINPAGTSVTLYKNGTTTVIGRAIVNGVGTWSVSASGLVSGDVLTAYVTDIDNTRISTVSNSDTVLARASGAPVITSANPAQGSTQITGTYSGTANTIHLYEDDYLIGTATVSGGNWTVNLANTADGPALYAGGVLYATATQAGSFYESDRSNLVTVGCAPMPTNATISPTTAGVCSGSTVEVTITNPAPGMLYTLKNATGTTAQSTSQYARPGNTTLTLTTFALTTQGTHSISVVAEEIGAIICRQTHPDQVTVAVQDFTYITPVLSSNSPGCSTVDITIQQTQSGYTYNVYDQATNQLAASATGTNSSLTIATPISTSTIFNVEIIDTSAPANCIVAQNNSISMEKQCEAVVTPIAPRNWYDNPNGSLLASASDADGAIVETELISSTLPAGTIEANTLTGTVVVLQRGLLRPGTYSLTLKTVDEHGGTSINTAELTFTGDRDGDLIDDFTDIDDNNDGIQNALSNKAGKEFEDEDADGILNFADPDYVHPYYGAWADQNNDGINDWFDLDQDGIINSLDLDMDNDGIFNSIEANTGAVPANFSTNTGQFSGTVTANGMPELAQTYPNSGESILLMPDTDVDQLPDYLDLDADSDGIPDRIEAQAMPETPASGLDENLNGMDDAFEPALNGKSIIPVDTDSDGTTDYLDKDSDNDLFPDTSEGFDLNGNGYALDDLKNLAMLFASNGGSTTYYLNDLDSDNNMTPDWLEYSTQSSTRNFLNPETTFYYDTNKDGLVDLFDERTSGTTTTPPDNSGNGIADFRDINSQTPLPVTFISFSATRQQGKVLVKWETAQEKDADYFTVERSTNGKNFQAIGSLPAKGNSNIRTAYQFPDEQPLASTGYYRLRQTDLDGTFSYTQMVAVRAAATTENAVEVFPNPFTDLVKLLVTSPANQEVGVQVFSQQGAILFTKVAYLVKGPNTLGADFGHLPAGVYLIAVTGNEGQVWKRVVKE